MKEEEMARLMLEAVNQLVEKKIRKIKEYIVTETIGKVASTSPLTVYLIGDMNNAIEVFNPYGLTLNVGDLVKVRFFPFKVDPYKYVACKL